MKPLVKEQYLISPFLVFFLIYSNQISVGILKFQRDISRHAGYDAWISVLLSGLSVCLVIALAYRLLKSANQDIVHIQQFCFGKWLGSVLNLAVISYFLLASLIVLRTYIEVVQVWMFPMMMTWEINIVILLLIYYIVSGGFRVVTGICFWGTVLPLIILFPISLFPMQFAHFTNLLPVFNHTMHDIVLSSRDMVFEFMGFESLLMFYPFIKNPDSSQKWALLGGVCSTLMYAVVTVISFAYFTEGQLEHVIWPTLTMNKIAEVPLIERFEYIMVSVWLLVVTPAISLNVWSACRGMKRLFNVKQRISLVIFLASFFIASNMLNDRRMIKGIIDAYENAGLYFIYLYIPLLFLLYHAKSWVVCKMAAER